MEPVDTVQALDEADAPTAYSQQAAQVTNTAGDEHGIAGSFCEAVTNLNATPAQPVGQFGLKGGDAACIGCFGEDTNARHAGIIP